MANIASPCYRVEPKKGKGKQATLVTVPEPEMTQVEAVSETPESAESPTTRHSEIRNRNQGDTVPLPVSVTIEICSAEPAHS